MRALSTHGWLATWCVVASSRSHVKSLLLPSTPFSWVASLHQLTTTDETEEPWFRNTFALHHPTVIRTSRQTYDDVITLQQSRLHLECITKRRKISSLETTCHFCVERNINQLANSIWGHHCLLFHINIKTTSLMTHWNSSRLFCLIFPANDAHSLQMKTVHVYYSTTIVSRRYSHRY